MNSYANPNVKHTPRPLEKTALNTSEDAHYSYVFVTKHYITAAGNI